MPDLIDTKESISKNFNTDIVKIGLPVFVFGTKGMAEDVYNCFSAANIDVAGFVDNNRCANDTFLGKKIYSLNEIEKYKDGCVVVIATVTYVYEIQKQLENSGFKNILPAYVLEFCTGLNFKQNPSIKNLAADYFEHKTDYKTIRNLLCDDLSQKTFDAMVEFRKTFDIEVYQSVKQPLAKQYFEDFIPEVFRYEYPFADCGGYSGDTALGFCSFTYNKYKKIYFIEADPATFEKGKEETAALRDIEYFKAAVTDCEKQLNFSADFNTGSKVTEEGLLLVEGKALDSIVKEDRAFIKMDIEGAEKEAILGAKRLIKNGSLLAVSAYHKAEDIRELPETIMNINPDYDFYLRHYTDTVFETVLYAVPKSC